MDGERIACRAQVGPEPAGRASVFRHGGVIARLFFPMNTLGSGRHFDHRPGGGISFARHVGLT